MISYAWTVDTVTAPICAACLEPIGNRGALKGKAVGTEVFHHKCIMAGGVETSLLRRTQGQVREAQNQNARSRKIEEETLEVLRKEQDEVFRLRKQVKEMNTDLIRARTRAAEDREAVINAQAHIVIVVRERDAARREAALYQAIGPPTAPNPAPAPVVVVEEKHVVEDEKDDMTKRYEMMELD